MTGKHDYTPLATRNRRRRQLGVIVSAGILTAALGSAAFAAGEPGSGGGGGGGGGTAVCAPVSSLTAKSDPRVGELGFASTQVSYSVKACDKNPVTVTAEVFQWNTPTNVVYLDSAAPLSNKFTVNGILVRTTYQVRISVYDATTGALEGTSSIYTAAIPKGV